MIRKSSNDLGNELAKHTHVQDVTNSNICQPRSIQFDLPIDFYNTKFYQIMLDYYAIMHFVFPPWASFKLKINFEETLPVNVAKVERRARSN